MTSFVMTSQVGCAAHRPQEVSCNDLLTGQLAQSRRGVSRFVTPLDYQIVLSIFGLMYTRGTVETAPTPQNAMEGVCLVDTLQ